MGLIQWSRILIILRGCMRFFLGILMFFATGSFSLVIAATGVVKTNSPCIISQGATSCAVDISYSASGAPVYCLWDISVTPKRRWTCQGYSNYGQQVAVTTVPKKFVLKAQQDWGDDSDATFSSGQTLTTVTVRAVDPGYSSKFPQNQSTYSSISSDIPISDADVVILQDSINISSADNVLVHSDGRYFLSSGSVAALVQIYVDGQPVGNNSIIDWRGSASVQQHSFNSIGNVYLGAGSHTVQLVGRVIGGSGSFTVGADSNLSIFVHPAENVIASNVDNDFGPVDLDTSSWNSENLVVAPAYTGLNVASVRTSSAPGDIVAISSGRVYKYAANGDALLKIYENGADPGNNYSSSSMQDVCDCAETQAPFYSHAFFPRRNSSIDVSLNASEGPWHQNGISDPASYFVGATSRLVVMYGGLQVAGAGTMVLDNSLATKAENSINQPWRWTCIATTIGSQNCSSEGVPNIIASENINIPEGHHGNVMFSAKARIQGDSTDSGGVVFLYIEIDGRRVGSTGVQSLGPNGTSISERTLTASYFATGVERLSSGTHLVRVYAVGNGARFKNLSLAQTLPLIWFD